MLLLTSTSDKIQLVTASTSSVHVQASWTDLNTGTVTPGRTNSIITTATTTDIVAAPAASTQRNVKSLIIRAVGGAQTLTLQHTDGTLVTTLWSFTMNVGESMVWTDGNGWQKMNTVGVPMVSNGITGAMTMVNVMDYGAKGDGSTNDLAAIQAAINAAGAMGVSGRGVDVYFPAGIYAINSTITCNFNNVMLRGSGWQSTVIYCTVTTGDVLQFGNGSGSFAGCGLMNMSVWKSAQGTTGANINVNKMNDVLIQNFVVNQGFNGIIVQGASIKVWMDQGEVNSCATTGVGIQVTNGAAGDTYIKDIIMSNNPAAKPAAGIRLTQTGHCSILRCNITSCAIGLDMNPGASQDVTYVFVDHSLFDSGGTHGLRVFPSASAGRARSVICVNSWFAGSDTNYGIEFNCTAGGTVDGFSFIGCRILNNRQHGVLFNSTLPTNISFTDCTVAGNGQQTINTYDGFNLIAAVSGVSIVNCGIGAQGAATNQQRYAINVAAGASANLYFAANQCAPNGTVGTHGYINIGALTGGGIIIDGNAPQVSMTMGASTIAASAAINTSETVISSPLRMAANGIRASATFSFVVAGSCTVSTAAAVPTFRVRLGTAGTTADTAIMTFTLPTSGGVGTSNFSMYITVTCRTIGASATFQGDVMITQASATLGLLSTIALGTVGTAAAGNTQNANFINLTYQGASANVTCTFQKVATEVIVS